MQFIHPLKLSAAKPVYNDEVLDYAGTRIKSTSHESKEKYLHTLAEFYIKTGDCGNALNIGKMIADEYYKYSIIFSLYSQDNPLGDALQKDVLLLEQAITDQYYTLDILLAKLSYHLKKKNHREPPVLLNELYPAIAEIKSNEG